MTMTSFLVEVGSVASFFTFGVILSLEAFLSFLLSLDRRRLLLGSEEYFCEFYCHQVNNCI